MFVLGNLIIAVGRALDMLMYVYIWVVIIRALISWVNPDPYNPIVRFLFKVTEPVMSRIRKYIPPISGIDLSPIIVIVAIFFVQQLFIQSLIEYGIAMKRGF
ncbi:MAG: YggT family protein [Candidatus Dadabacteria bacterium]|nr:YggT family protein [Candidatus Dadabacteria bacterium]